MLMSIKRKQQGFTIVELLIVIVVIAILAAISVVAYTGIQQRARDSQRDSDIATIAKALEMYYIDNGRFPPGSCSSDCAINGGWSTTADGSWTNLAAYLVPEYISEMPEDPVSTADANPQTLGNYNYAYYGHQGATYCGRPVYILVFNYESRPEEDTLIGTCDTVNFSTLGPYGGSNYRVVKR